MEYKCEFDFTVCKPKTSQFTGKSGYIHLNADREMDATELTALKTSPELEVLIHQTLTTAHKQKNIFMITVKALTPIVPKPVKKSKHVPADLHR